MGPVQLEPTSSVRERRDEGTTGENIVVPYGVVNSLNKTIAVYGALALFLTGCIQLPYVRPILRDIKPALNIPAEREIRRLAVAGHDPIQALLEAKELPQIQVAQ